MTSICSIGLATMSIADPVTYEPSDTVRDIQLQRLEHHLTKDLDNSETSQLQPASAEAINLIKEFEGFESQAYIDTNGTPV
ncbi:MAG: hypothetical protein ACRDBG_05460, partial [Waterburya sp.]